MKDMDTTGSTASSVMTACTRQQGRAEVGGRDREQRLAAAARSVGSWDEGWQIAMYTLFCSRVLLARSCGGARAGVDAHLRGTAAQHVQCWQPVEVTQLQGPGGEGMVGKRMRQRRHRQQQTTAP